MPNQSDVIKMIFGFKVKYLRQQKGLSFQELSDKTKLSISYLHDIEKGRKYPKIDKINALATALGVDYEYMVSLQASKKLQPVIDLMTSEFLQIFPLELFGILPDKLFDLLSNAPDKVNAFISTIFKIARHYHVQDEDFYYAALRSYQDMSDNYFEDIEIAATSFKQEYATLTNLPLTTKYLEDMLFRVYGIMIDRHILGEQPSLSTTRSYYAKDQKTLYLNSDLNNAQENFLIARELGFQYLNIKEERPYLTRIVKVESFEKLLNNFKASYFAVALIMPEQEVIADIKSFGQLKEWNNTSFLQLLDKYDVTPEMLMQRLTNILPKHFDMGDLFFLRLSGSADLQRFEITKELHLSRLHSPYSNEGTEHYCRRWISVNIIKQFAMKFTQHPERRQLADIQISQYYQTDNSYWCISIAKPAYKNPKETISVTLGLMLNEKVRTYFPFLNDPNLPKRIVFTTCERCAIPDCEARISPPTVIQEAERKAAILNTIEKI